MSTKREHTKSRLGCKQCKKRRIKCDETPPRCDNCTKKGIDCDYQDWEDVFRRVQFLNPPNIPQPNPQLASMRKVEPLAPSVSSQTFSLEDLGLHYHFVMHTSLTMDFHGEHTEQLWQREVPQIAQQNVFLMHALLAFAAVHLTKTTVEHTSQNLQLARLHYGQAVTLFRQSMKEISTERAEALLCFGMLVNFLSINLDLEQTEGERDPINDFATFFNVIRNSVQMLMPIRQSVQASGIATQFRNAFNAPQPHQIASDASDSIDRLREFVSLRYPYPGLESDEVALINDTLNKLEEFYTLVDPRPTTWARILNWPIQLDPDFSILIRQRDPIALCILGHWCVPYHNAPKRWYFGERPRLLMLAIAKQLHGSEWIEGIKWPLSQTVDVA